MAEHLISLRKQVAAARARIVDLDKAAGDKPMTPEQLTEFEAASADLQAKSTRLEQAELAEREAARIVQPAAEILGDAPKPRAAVTVGEPNALARPGVPFARFIASMAAAHRLKQSPSEWYAAKFGAGDMVHAALSPDSVAGGGGSIPQDIFATIAPLLQAKALVRRSGVVPTPMPRGNISIVRQTGGATFRRVAPNVASNASSPTFGGVNLTSKSMVGSIPIHNDLIRWSALQIDQEVVRASVDGIAVAEDVDFLRGTGVGANVKGMRYIATAAAGNLLTMTATPDVAKIKGDLRRLVHALASKNVPMSQCFWGFSPREALYLQYLDNSLGARVFPEMADGTLMGFPFGMSTSIPITLGGGTESEVYLWDAAECAIGDAEDVNVQISTEASYTNESGSLVSAWDLNQTVIKISLANDFGMFHNEGCAVLTGVTWGA